MDELVRVAWGLINCKYAEGLEPCPEDFMAKYGHLLYEVPMLAKPLPGPYLKRRLMGMRPSAMGLDGCGLQDPDTRPSSPSRARRGPWARARWRSCPWSIGYGKGPIYGR